jgi:hypothetical protein
MKLIKPRFDFENQKIWLAPVVSKNASNGANENGSADRTKPKLVEFAFPQPCYLTSTFTQPAQMKRIMAAKVLRLNNYTLQATDPGEKMPDAKSDPIEISGKVEFNADSKQPVLIVGDNRYDLLLGHRGATIAGFSIATLDPDKVLLTVTGVQDDSGIVNAQKIDLLPTAKTSND